MRGNDLDKVVTPQFRVDRAHLSLTKQVKPRLVSGRTQENRLLIACTYAAVNQNAGS